jgi:hypothetical protein
MFWAKVLVYICFGPKYLCNWYLGLTIAYVDFENLVGLGSIGRGGVIAPAWG